MKEHKSIEKKKKKIFRKKKNSKKKKKKKKKFFSPFCSLFYLQNTHRDESALYY